MFHGIFQPTTPPRKILIRALFSSNGEKATPSDEGTRSLTLEKIRPDRCTFSAGAEFVNHPEHDVTAEQVFVQCVARKAVHQSCARLGTTAGWIPRSRRRLHRFGSRRFASARGARRFRQPWLRPWTLRLSRSNLLPQFEARRTDGTEPDIVVGVVRVVVVALRATAVVGVVVPVAAAQQTAQGHFRNKAADRIRRTSIFGTDPAARAH